MKKIYSTMLLSAALFSTTASAQILMTSSESYGDAMSGGTKKSGETKYFYDANAKIVAKYENKFNNQTAVPFQRVEYNYNAKGYLVSETLYQWGLFDEGNDGWDDGSTTEYEVDANGNRTAVYEVYTLPWAPTKPIKYKQYVYAYDNDGNMTKEQYYFSQYGADAELQWTATYTYGNVNGTMKPTKKVMKSIWESECYHTDYTYDAAGNKIMEEDIYDVPEQAGRLYNNKHVWTYDNDGFLTKYERYQWIARGSYDDGDYYIVLRTPYEKVNGNSMVVKHSDFTASPWFNGDEVVDTELSENPGSAAIDKYVDFTDMAEYLGCSLTAEVSDANTNTVHLAVTMPEGTQIGTVRYDVYRDAQFLSSHLLSELAEEGNIDTENGIVNIYDSNVKNGTHKYFIQIVKPENDEVGEEAVEWIGYNVSNVAEVTAEIQDLPVATNLRIVEASRNAGTASIGYDFPATVDTNLGFAGNSLFIKTLGTFRLTPDETTTKAGNGILKATLIASDNIDVYVESRYKYGKVRSEVVTLPVGETTAISAIEVENLKGATFFDMNGRQVANSNLRGAYIMIANGKISKVIVK